MSEDSKVDLVGNFGTYLDNNNLFTFQLGTMPSAQSEDPLFNNQIISNVGGVEWLTVSGFNVLSRGGNNMQCEEIEHDIKQNRLLPSLLDKQFKMLYGHGPCLYKEVLNGSDIKKEWLDDPEIRSWLEGWIDNGMESDYKDFAKSIIKNYYYFKDFFVKWRMTMGKQIGTYPVAGLEMVENKYCRLATTRTDVTTSPVYYRDFKNVLVGKWASACSGFQVYKRFLPGDIDSINFAAISHHREKSVGEFYGMNETHSGTKDYILASNNTPQYLNSFLNNALAAKVHIIIPDAWRQSQRMLIKALIDENVNREKNGETLLRYNGLEIGTKYKESILIQNMQTELRKLSSYLSGTKNQGKAYASISFLSGQDKVEQRWRIETIDLKYKEYVESIIEYDKKAEEAMVSSVGMDASISAISKDGIISKSGADVYYNYLIYLMQLSPVDEKCAEPFNWALRLNFPKQYASGIRLGFYREVPAKQEDVAPNNRLNKQQS